MQEQDKLQSVLGTRYRITGTIGRGGMGTVYAAMEQLVGREVAIKAVYLPEEQTRERFSTEVRSLSRLHHLNILQLLEAGEMKEILYYITPLIKGGSLETLLQERHQLGLSQALSIALAVAAALLEAHKHRIIHRDLKPSNILIPDDGNGPQYDRSLVSDFGVVGVLRPNTDSTQFGQIYGTPEYMSPEQIRGMPQTTATDVYGLGLLLYKMIFGQTPFKHDDAFSLMQQIVSQEVFIPAVPSLPEPLRLFLQRCLIKDPAARPKDPYSELSRIQASIDSAPARQASITAPSQGPLAKTWFTHGSKGCIFAFSAVLVVLAAIAVYFFAPSANRQLILDLSIGVLLVASGVVLGSLIRSWLLKRQGGVRDEASKILFGLGNRSELGATLAIEVEELIAKCKALDEIILGKTVALMIGEYRDATSFDDRKDALVTAVQFLEKLTARMSPWYIKYEKLIVALVSLIGLVAGVIKIIEAISKL